MSTPMSWCCSTLENQAQPCPEHGLECRDQGVRRWPNNTFVIPLGDGRSSGILIDFCPWCGSPLANLVIPDREGHS